MLITVSILLNRNKMIKSLTSVRFIFAFMVFLSHLSFLKTNTPSVSGWLFENIFSKGSMGVCFFFVLSGFILSYSYHDKFSAGNLSRSLFYVGRFSRIYPLHIFCFALSIPLLIYSYEGHLLKILVKAVFNLTLTQSFVPIRSVYFSFNAPSWSLSDEMFFYLLFPLLTISIRPKNILNSTLIALILTFAVIVLLLIIPKHFHHALFYINPVSRLYDFVIGIILFSYYRHIKCNSIKLGLSFEIISLISFIVFFIMRSCIPATIVNSVYYMIPICLVILSISLEQGMISCFLQSKLFVSLGEVSFSFYMIHQLVIRYRGMFCPNSISGSLAIDSIILFIISIVLSYVVYNTLELNAKNWIRNVYAKRYVKV